MVESGQPAVIPEAASFGFSAAFRLRGGLGSQADLLHDSSILSNTCPEIGVSASAISGKYQHKTY